METQQQCLPTFFFIPTSNSFLDTWTTVTGAAVVEVTLPLGPFLPLSHAPLYNWHPHQNQHDQQRQFDSHTNKKDGLQNGEHDIVVIWVYKVLTSGYDADAVQNGTAEAKVNEDDNDSYSCGNEIEKVGSDVENDSHNIQICHFVQTIVKQISSSSSNNNNHNISYLAVLFQTHLDQLTGKRKQ
eukprot:7832922-Ditylum_brightwellii.AAC.1